MVLTLPLKPAAGRGPPANPPADPPARFQSYHLLPGYKTPVIQEEGVAPLHTHILLCLSSELPGDLIPKVVQNTLFQTLSRRLDSNRIFSLRLEDAHSGRTTTAEAMQAIAPAQWCGAPRASSLHPS